MIHFSYVKLCSNRMSDENNLDIGGIVSTELLQHDYLHKNSACKYFKEGRTIRTLTFCTKVNFLIIICFQI